MPPRWRALLGFAVLTLFVNVVAGARLHLHPGHEDGHGRLLVHSHGSGEPHSHAPSPASSPEHGDRGDDHDAVVVIDALRVLPSPAVATTVDAPMFLPEPAVVVAALEAWRAAPDTTRFHSHGPPSARLVPARAPPIAPRQIS